MTLRSTIVALAALASTGCWPVIPGHADDYVIPETSQVTGAFSLNTPIGGYWSSTTPTGSSFWGVFAAPTAVSGTEIWGVDDTCTRNPTTTNDMAALFRTGGTGASRFVQGDTELSLTWSEGAKAFIGAVSADSYVADTTYDLAAIEFGDLGSIEIPEFVETGGTDFVVTSHPQFADDVMPVVTGPEALAFTWDDERQDRVVISVLAFDSANEQIEDVTCIVDDKGSYTVPADLFQNVDQTAYVVVLIGTLSLNGGTTTIGGVEQGYVTSSAYTVQGGLAYGTP